jgi:hypothetical protein
MARRAPTDLKGGGMSAMTEDAGTPGTGEALIAERPKGDTTVGIEPSLRPQQT